MLYPRNEQIIIQNQEANIKYITSNTYDSFMYRNDRNLGFRATFRTVPDTSDNKQSGCGGPMAVQENETFGYWKEYRSSSDNGRTCQWELEAPEGKRIQVHVTRLSLFKPTGTSGSSCWDTADHLYYQEAGGRKYCGKNENDAAWPESLLSTTNKMTLQLWLTNEEVQDDNYGFEAYYTIVDESILDEEILPLQTVVINEWFGIDEKKFNKITAPYKFIYDVSEAEQRLVQLEVEKSTVYCPSALSVVSSSSRSYDTDVCKWGWDRDFDVPVDFTTDVDVVYNQINIEDNYGSIRDEDSRGFKARFVYDNSGKCGRYKNVPADTDLGTIGFPNSYSQDWARCSWDIKAPEGHGIKIIFHEESSSDCDRSKIKITRPGPETFNICDSGRDGIPEERRTWIYTTDVSIHFDVYERRHDAQMQFHWEAIPLDDILVDDAARFKDSIRFSDYNYCHNSYGIGNEYVPENAQENEWLKELMNEKGLSGQVALGTHWVDDGYKLEYPEWGVGALTYHNFPAEPTTNHHGYNCWKSCAGMHSNGEWYQITCGYASCAEYNNWYKRATCKVDPTTRSAGVIEEECEGGFVRQYNKVKGECAPIESVQWTCDWLKNQNISNTYNLKRLQSWRKACAENRVETCEIDLGWSGSNFCEQIMNAIAPL